MADEIGEFLKHFVENEKQTKVEKMKRLNKFVKEGQILFTGSSLMEHFPINELAQGHSSKLIYNRGVGGSTSKEFIEHLDALLLDLKPSKVFINIGTNDLSNPNFTNDQLIENYRFILSRLDEVSKDAKVYFIAFYPMNENKLVRKGAFGNRTNELVSSANLALTTFLKDYKNVKILDFNSKLRDEEGRLKEEYTMDGVHLYPDVYKIIFDGLKDLL